MEKKVKNSNLLQSEQWRKFQEAVGRKTFAIEREGSISSADKFLASVIEHKLPIVGKYEYVPRGPILNFKFEILNEIQNAKDQIKNGMREMIELAKKENAGWIRIEPKNEQDLVFIRQNISERIVKAPHDMQPREVFIIDISKSADDLLSEMKPKTRYNINLAKKKNVIIRSTDENINEEEKERFVEEFLRLTKEMAARHGINAHPEEYYRKMIKTLPVDTLRIYVAEIDGEIIAANLVLFFGNMATYLHGASGNTHRNLMAPFLLQWKGILDAKEMGCTKYDFGGIKSVIGNQSSVVSQNDWHGITVFKQGFSPKTKPVVFPGSYDIIVDSRKYAVYRGLQKAKSFAVKFRKH